MSNTTQGGGQFIGNLQGGAGPPPPSGPYEYIYNPTPLTNYYIIFGKAIFGQFISTGGFMQAFQMPANYASLVSAKARLVLAGGASGNYNLTFNSAYAANGINIPAAATAIANVYNQAYVTDVIKEVDISAQFTGIAAGSSWGNNLQNNSGVNFLLLSIVLVYN